jgi:HK97 family phage prohead protease
MDRLLTPSGLPIYSEKDFIAHAEAKDLPESLAVVKGFVSEVKAVKDTNRFRFMISTEGVDRDKDVINVGGWKLDNYKKNPVVLFGHDYRSLPVGKATSIKSTKKGLDSEVEFASAETYPFAETVRRMVAGGFLSAASVGFKPLKYMYNEERRGVDIEESELLEWSIVPVPANPECLVQLSAALAPGMLDEFAKSCEQFMEACKGKGQWVVEADLKRAETAVADFLEFKDELKAQLIAIGEAKQANEKDSPAIRAIADLKAQGQVEAAADELEIKNGEIIFEDEADYIFGLDITAVTETVKEATRQALKDQAVRHIKSQIDYARGRIQE